MTWKDYPIFQREDKSFIIVMNGFPYHVPNEGEWIELYTEVADFYANNEISRAEVEFYYTDLHPDPVHEQDHEPTFYEVKSRAISRIDYSTSKAILSGFDYEVGGEILHFSYDSFDQQNFADTANVATLLLSGIEGLPTSITWNAYRDYTPETGGELVRINLDVTEYLALYTQGALVHKATKMEVCGYRKDQIKAATSVEEINNLLKEWNI